ncbi:arylsulfatase [Flammeovirga aprica]|nr:arylsulfatase [Flammeovirga aprica]
MKKITSKMICGLLSMFTLLSVNVFAQEQIPQPIQEFKGKIGRTYAESESDYPQPVKPKAGSPNVIVVMLDDVGFGQSSTFGGPVEMDNLDKLADEGLTYTRFHTTGMCSPTRAALLTGKNHHEAGFGVISELSTGFPGYNSIWPDDAASIAQILQGNGYSTSIFGKWHNTPTWEVTANGPFDRWPTGLGFDYFYGFNGGETSQYEPDLYRNTTPVDQPYSPEEGYHLTEDLADDAIRWMKTQKSNNPDQPFFLYFSTGAAHSPLQAPDEFIEKYKGKFDNGWDAMREETFNRQKEMGIIPANTKLTERPEVLEAWDSYTDEERKVLARQMEVYAGFLDHTDHYVGEVLKTAKSLPGGENTVVIYIVGDNGPSAEGSMTGTSNVYLAYNGLGGESFERQLKDIDEWGTPSTEPHYAVSWAWAGSSPFKWMKRVPSHFGGTRNGLVISWPEGIQNKGEKRTQFHHVSDITPTILEITGIEQPKTVKGFEQSEMSGVSMAYTFKEEHAKGQRDTQYFEIEGSRAIYHDGWVACAFHGIPWQLNGSKNFDDAKWELYNIEEDFSQSKDLADQYPEKLEELKALFESEAASKDVYPMDDRFVERIVTPDRPSINNSRTKFTYYGVTERVTNSASPRTPSRNHDIVVDLNHKKSDEGVLVTDGGFEAGYSLYIKDNRLYYTYNFFDQKYTNIISEIELPEGDIQLKAVYDQVSGQRGGAAKVTLMLGDKVIGSGDIPRTIPVQYSATSTFDVGKNTGSSPSEFYHGDFTYSGEIQLVEVTLK